MCTSRWRAQHCQVLSTPAQALCIHSWQMISTPEECLANGKPLKSSRSALHPCLANGKHTRSRAPVSTPIKLKAGMRLKYMGSKAWLAPHLDRLLGDVTVLHPPAPGPGGARRRHLRARRKPAPLLLEARPGLPALLAAPGGAQGGQALLLQAPPAGRSERPCRASGCLLIRPAAQQLLGKVGLLRAAAATGAEQRVASATATDKGDRAASGRTGLSARSALPGAPAVHLCRPSLHLPRSQHELLWHKGGMTWPSTRSSETHSSQAACPSS